MSGVIDLYFPSADARELNGDLRKEHLAFLADRPDWAPPELGWVPRPLVRFLNRLAPRLGRQEGARYPAWASLR